MKRLLIKFLCSWTLILPLLGMDHLKNKESKEKIHFFSTLKSYLDDNSPKNEEDLREAFRTMHGLYPCQKMPNSVETEIKKILNQNSENEILKYPLMCRYFNNEEFFNGIEIYLAWKNKRFGILTSYEPSFLSCVEDVSRQCQSLQKKGLYNEYMKTLAADTVLILCKDRKQKVPESPKQWFSFWADFLETYPSFEEISQSIGALPKDKLIDEEKKKNALIFFEKLMAENNKDQIQIAVLNSLTIFNGLDSYNPKWLEKRDYIRTEWEKAGQFLLAVMT